MGKLTVRGIESAKPKKAAYHLADGDGLRLRIATDGSKAWQVKYTANGKETTVTLARRYGARTDDGHLSLEDARFEATAIRAKARQGIDHRTEEAQRLAAERKRHEAEQQRLTVRQLFTEWSSLDLVRRKDQGAETKRGLEKDVLPKLGDRHADTIRRADIMSVLDAVKARGAARLANRLLAELRQMFGFALVREIVAADPTSGIEKKHVGGQEQERERVLSEAEIRSLPAKLADANLLKTTQHAVWVMLATLARIGELTQARRADIDLVAGTWIIPASHSKNAKEHTIYLSEFAKTHLRALLELNYDEVWLFPAARKNGSVSSKSITKQIYDRQGAASGTPLKHRSLHIDALVLPGGRWTPHDLRRTGATLMGELGVHGDVIEKCLNHLEQNKIKRTYQRAVRQQEQADAWRVLGARLELLVDNPSNVVPLRPEANLCAA
ncbi:tyrosine-type recombinase/integrase [Paraburkholderia sp. GAS348]|uniref:tyrosine-type recombinase/integrase n=1 Tax=Paraburkholderia sp. GAS348 TaxID=3035132 RepID=UPI003D252056